MSPDLFETVTPRREVLSGELTEAMFAAALEDVVAGTAPADYQDPPTFFASSYPSGGLKALLNESLGRLGGGKPDAAGVIRVETSLGGGKTHNLIALYHAARGFLTDVEATLFMDPDLVPAGPVEQIGVLVGTDAGATTFPTLHGTSPQTVWGWLALQIGGPDGYAHVAEDDARLTAPGAGQLRAVFGERPTLILIDEIARYYAVAMAVPVAGSTLAKQMTAFLMALMQAVDSSPRASLVITTTGLTDAFGSQTEQVLAAVDEARELMARREIVLRAAEEADLPQILSRRLFESIPPGAAGEVAALYQDALQAAYAAGTDLPVSISGSQFRTDVGRTYPFHPSLVRVLDKRLSTIPNFQRTRGALRLMARVVRGLWQQRPAGTLLVHPHAVNLADRVVAEDLSSRLERAELEPVIRVDIASQAGGESSHAEQVDAAMGGPFARRLATTAYLWSLTKDIPGVPTADLLASVLAPGEDPNVVTKALDKLDDSCWYLHADARGWRFTTEASLTKLIQEHRSQVSDLKARAQATTILSGMFKDGALKVRRVWEGDAVPDNADDTYLVLLHWDDFGDTRGLDPSVPVPDRIRALWEKTPSGGQREFRNRMVILAPSKDGHPPMVEAVRTHLALTDLTKDPAVLGNLTVEKRRELQERRQTSELEARIAVANHVNVLHVPRGAGLEGTTMPVATASSVQRNQSDAVLDRLAADDKTLRAGDKPLDPRYVRGKLGAQFDTPQPTTELQRAFARRTDLRMVLDVAQLRQLVVDGVRGGVWDYQDPGLGDHGWATRDKPTAAPVKLSPDTFLHPPGSAPAPPDAVCPLCGNTHPGTTCDGPGGAPPPPAPGSVFSAAGGASYALTQALSSAAGAGRSQLTALTVSIDVTGPGRENELAKLHTMLAAGTATDVEYRIRAQVALDTPSRSLLVEFTGTPAQWSPMNPALRQALSGRDAHIQAAVAGRFPGGTPLDGDVVDRVQRAAGQTGPASCTIRLTTEDAA